MSNILYPAIISSIAETTITHPVDVIKIHKQTNKSIIYNFKTLYSGFFPRALGNIPSRTIFLFSQDYLTKYFSEDNKDNKYKYIKNIKFIIIPLCSGFAQTLFDTPVEVLKMNQIMKIKNTSLYKGLYKGFISHFGRNFIFILSVYNFRQLSFSNSNNSNNKYLHTALYGSIGGMVGSYISHPLDTIKTRIQTNRDFKHFTIKDYFIGSNLRASMALINMFISLYIFELIKK